MVPPEATNWFPGHVVYVKFASFHPSPLESCSVTLHAGSAAVVVVVVVLVGIVVVVVVIGIDIAIVVVVIDPEDP